MKINHLGAPQIHCVYMRELRFKKHPLNKFKFLSKKTSINSDFALFHIKVDPLKGTGHDFFLSETPMNHFRRHWKIHINQKKQQNTHKIAEIMNKMVLYACFIL